MNESILHEHIYARSQTLIAGSGAQVIVGPGDDCAVIESATGDLQLLTVDQVIEGRHFISETPINLIARKAIARSVSDIAAMGGTPCWATATGALPKGYAHANELFDAMHKWANHWSCPLVGGDIATHSQPDHPLTLTVTVGGRMLDSEPVLRSGAKPCDQLFVTGRLGNSFASDHHLNFEPRIELGKWASKLGAHAMMDISDGLGRDSDRIAKASGVRIEINAAHVPMNSGCAGWKQAVSEGEDYELLIALDPSSTVGTAPVELFGPIGVVHQCKPNEKPGSTIVDPGGLVHDAEALGWDH